MSSYTLSVLSGLLYDQLDGNNLLYPQGQATQVLNDTVRKLNFLTGMIQNYVTDLTQANQLAYNTPAGMILPNKLYLEGVELEKYSLRELGTKYRNWMTDTTAAYGPIARWAPIGINQYVLHPADAIGGRLIEFSGVQPITPMVNSGNSVDLEDEFVPVLIDFDRGRIQLKLGGKPFASASASYQMFIKGVKSMVAWESMVFPRYFVEEALEGAEGKGA